MRKANPKFRWHVTAEEKATIRAMTLAGNRQSVIARELRIRAASISKAQRAMRLPTRLTVPEKKIMKLFLAGWGGYKISRHLHVPVNQVYRVAHENAFRRSDAAGYPTPPENEAAFIEAVKNREDYVIRLAAKYGVGIIKAGRLARQVLACHKFRPGASRPPLSSNLPQKHFDPKMAKSDEFVQLVHRIFGGTLPFAKEHDGHAVAAILICLQSLIPDFRGQPPEVLHHFALGLVEAINCVRANTQQSN